MLSLNSSPLPAKTITVNSTADVANSSDGLCTLREAITAANTNTASGTTAGECVAGESSASDTINFSVTGAISLASALPDIPDLTINGPGASQMIVQRSTASETRSFRIFTVNSGKTVTIFGMTITNGETPDTMSGLGNYNGGAILNSGTLSLMGVVVNGNRTGFGGFGSSGNGGGIFQLRAH